MSVNKNIEEGTTFEPKFNKQGLIPVVVVDAVSNEVLMVANMNEQALRETLTSGKGTYYSRSRGQLWVKGEQSGHVQKVVEMLVDCDQDCLVLRVQAQGGQCHVGYRSCFYRRVKPGTTDQLEFVAKPVFDPKQVYGK
ncbi:MAG: phosphoribosyl-AMP cyclohydrolase [Actinobacteria bacterium]|nr:phosphoribosyl-AMP cyclohydrolase [Actinomycetota bacterium]